MMAPTLNVALDYAGRRWPVLPLEPGGKRPAGKLCPHGLHDASTDVGTITSWWRAVPEANIGLRTGVAFDVVDLDGPDAVSALDAAMPQGDGVELDVIIIGPTVRTPRGWHVYLAPTGKGNATNVGRLPGVDWRGQGGYVVAPGSRKADGSRWEWYLPGDPLYGPDATIRPSPAWLLSLLDRRRQTPVTGSRPPGQPTEGDAYGRAALERALGRIALAPEGTRNHALNAEAHGLGKVVATGHLRGSEVAAALLDVALRIGLDETEAKATIRSGFFTGLRASA